MMFVIAGTVIMLLRRISRRIVGFEGRESCSVGANLL
jgi:hypothetical protein